MKGNLFCILITATLLFCSSCKYSNTINGKNEKSIEGGINEFLKVESIYENLSNDYAFRLYDNGVGKDLSKSYKNDSILILKNQITSNLDKSLLNKGKVLILDSLELCNLSIKLDEERKIMRNFIVIRKGGESNYDVFTVQWVPQYLSEKPICIELEKSNPIHF